MCETLFADALGSGLSGKVAGYAIKALAVGGGLLVGYALGIGVAWALDRWVFAHKAPPQLKKLCGLLAGVALAILVALIVFGEGGGGLFGGGGGSGGDSKGTPTPTEKGKEPPAPVTPKEDVKVPPKVEPKTPDPKATPGDVRIAILSGTDVAESKDGKEVRYYLIGDDTTPKSLNELKKAIADRRAGTKEELVLVFRFTKEPLSNNFTPMKLLSAWLKEAKLTIRFE